MLFPLLMKLLRLFLSKLDFFGSKDIIYSPSPMFLELIRLYLVNINPDNKKHVNPKQEYTILDDGYYVSCCNTKVSTLVEDMESRFNTLYVVWKR